ncbi:phosphopantetheine-binding protein [Enterococcus casseliflavus]
MSNLRQEVFDLFQSSAASSLNVSKEEITEASNLEKDFKAKSLNFVQIIGDIEDEFEYDLNFMKFRNQSTVKDQLDYIIEVIEG